MVRAPALSVLPFHPLKDIAEPGVEVGKRLNSVLLAKNGIGELLVDDVFRYEIDKRIGLRIDVVLVEENLRELKNLAQAPGERRDVVEQCFVVPESVESEALCGVGRKILDALERLRLYPELLVERLVRLFHPSRLIEIAEVGALDVETHRRDRSLVFREMLEHRREQPLDGARLGRESRHTGNVEMRRLRSEEKIRVEINDGFRSTGAVDADWNPRVRSLSQVAVHAQRDLYVGLFGEKDLAHRHRL